MKRSLFKIALFGSILGLVAILFTPLGPKVKGYASRMWYKNAVAQKADKQVSEEVYSWQLTDIEGNPYSFGEATEQVIFLNFWATWCAPCIKEMPDIQKLYDDYGEKVSFLLVTDEENAKVQAFLQKKKFDLPVYFSKKIDIPEELTFKLIPTTYIIGRSGKIAEAETGAVDWNSDEIRSLLDELLAE